MTGLRWALRSIQVGITWILLAGFLGGCQSELPSAGDDSPLLGYWIGQRADGEHRVHWAVWRRPAGTFDAAFLQCLDQEVVSFRHESGHWERQQNEYHTRTLVISDGETSWLPNNPEQEYHQIYRILQLSDDRFRYQKTASGPVYEMVRAGPDTRLSCDMAWGEL